MTPNEYQELAARTICSQHNAKNRITNFISVEMMLLHASVGISGESGELSSAIERWIWYNQGLDLKNIYEELGDLLWYITEACIAMDTTVEQIMVANILKLQKRYPEKYTDHDAKEENRDRESERDILADVMDNEKREQTGQGWAEPPIETQQELDDADIVNMNGFDVARTICDRLLGRDRRDALKIIEQKEREFVNAQKGSTKT